MNTVKFGVLKEAESQLAWHSLKNNTFSFTNNLFVQTQPSYSASGQYKAFVCCMRLILRATSSDCPMCSHSNLRINV